MIRQLHTNPLIYSGVLCTRHDAISLISRGLAVFIVSDIFFLEINSFRKRGEDDCTIKRKTFTGTPSL